MGLLMATQSNSSLDKNHIRGEAVTVRLKVAAGERQANVMLCSKSKLLLAQF